MCVIIVLLNINCSYFTGLPMSTSEVILRCAAIADNTKFIFTSYTSHIQCLKLGGTVKMFGFVNFCSKTVKMHACCLYLADNYSSLSVMCLTLASCPCPKFYGCCSKM